MKKSFRIVLFLLIPFCSKAQDSLLTLEQAVGTALQNNYNILLVKNDAKSLSIDRSYIYAGFLPRLNGTATKIWNTNAQKQELSNGVKRDTSGIKSNNLQASLNMNWTIFDGLRMFIVRDRLIELDKLGELNVRNQVVTTISEVIVNYYSIVRSKLQLKAIDEQISINEERVKLADRKYSVGLGAKPELLQAKVDLNAQKSSRLRQVTLIQQLKEQLNQRMAVATNAKYEVSDSIPINTNLQYGDLQTGIVTSNPSLKIAQKNIEIANILIKERKSELFPTLSFNSAYNFSQLRNKAVINTFTPLFNQNRGFNFGFGLTVPILNNFTTRRAIEQAKLQLDFQKLSYQNQLSHVDLQLSNAFKQYELQKLTLALEEENISLARENVTIALERFRQGVSTYLELREAQISLEQALDRLIAARFNTKLAETDLLRIKGDLYQ